MSGRKRKSTADELLSPEKRKPLLLSFRSICIAFDQLPDDIIYLIAGELGLSDLLCLSKTCHRLHSALLSEINPLWLHLCKSRYSIASCPIGANYFLLFRLFRKVELISQSSRLKRAMRNDSSKRRWFFRFCAATISQVLRAGSGDAGKWWWWASLWYSRHSLEYKGLPWLRTREVKEVWSLTDSELKKHGAERKKYAGFWVYPWPSLYEAACKVRGDEKLHKHLVDQCWASRDLVDVEFHETMRDKRFAVFIKWKRRHRWTESVLLNFKHKLMEDYKNGLHPASVGIDTVKQYMVFVRTLNDWLSSTPDATVRNFFNSTLVKNMCLNFVHHRMQEDTVQAVVLASVFFDESLLFYKRASVLIDCLYKVCQKGCVSQTIMHEATEHPSYKAFIESGDQSELATFQKALKRRERLVKFFNDQSWCSPFFTRVEWRSLIKPFETTFGEIPSVYESDDPIQPTSALLVCVKTFIEKGGDKAYQGVLHCVKGLISLKLRTLHGLLDQAIDVPVSDDGDHLRMKVQDRKKERQGQKRKKQQKMSKSLAVAMVDQEPCEFSSDSFHFMVGSVSEDLQHECHGRGLGYQVCSTVSFIDTRGRKQPKSGKATKADKEASPYPSEEGVQELLDQFEADIASDQEEADEFQFTDDDED